MLVVLGVAESEPVNSEGLAADAEVAPSAGEAADSGRRPEE